MTKTLVYTGAIIATTLIVPTVFINGKEINTSKIIRETKAKSTHQ